MDTKLEQIAAALQRPKLQATYGRCRLSPVATVKITAEERGAGNLPRPTFCGTGGGRPPPVTWWAVSNDHPLPHFASSFVSH